MALSLVKGMIAILGACSGAFAISKCNCANAVPETTVLSAVKTARARRDLRVLSVVTIT